MNRYNTKKCKICGTVTSILAERTDNVKLETGWEIAYRDSTGRVLILSNSGAGIKVLCRKCGAPRFAIRVWGKKVESIKCDGRCTHATGHNCECSCGGKNHGRDHA